LRFLKKRFKQPLEQSTAKGEIDMDVDFGAPAIVGKTKAPVVSHVLERSFDQSRIHGQGVTIHRYARRKALPHHFEPNDQIRNDVLLRPLTYAAGNTPR